MKTNQTATRNKWLKFVFNISLFCFGITLIFLIISASEESFITLLKKIIAVKYPYVLTILAISYIQYLLVAKRWGLLMNCYTDTTSLPRGFIFYNTIIGLLVGSFLPVLGYIGIKSASCKFEHNISASKTAYAVSIEHVIGFSVVLPMILPALLYISGLVNLTYGIIINIFIIMALLIGFSQYYKITLSILAFVFTNIVKIINKIPFFKKKIDEDLFATSSFHSINKKTSITLVCLSLAMYFIVLFKCNIYFKAFNIDVSMLEFSLLYSIGYIMSSLGVTPGNLGMAELGWFSVLLATGAGRDNAALYAVGQRVINTGIVIFLAIASYVFYLTQKPKE